MKPMEPRRTRILNVVTSPLSAGLMRGQLRYLRERNFEVFLASAPGPKLTSVCEEEQVQAVPLGMEREISLFRDAGALLRLWWLMRRIHPTITNVSTPKAGLLGGIAAVAARIPCRVYTVRGLRWETTTGIKRTILKTAEWIACKCAHRVICVSQNLRHAVVEVGIASAERTVVLGDGSSNGVDCQRFAPTDERRHQATILRQRLGIEQDAPVLGFVGRLTRDKGIEEVYGAFDLLQKEFKNAHLLLLGDFEEGDPVNEEVRAKIEGDSAVTHIGFVKEMASYYQAMDVLVHPSYREGFPNVVLEAYAAEKPVVGARVTGTADAVLDGVTGFLVERGQVRALADAIAVLLRDSQLARRMGLAGRSRALERYQPERIWEALDGEYRSLLKQRGLELPGPALPSGDVVSEQTVG